MLYTKHNSVSILQGEIFPRAVEINITSETLSGMVCNFHNYNLMFPHILQYCSSIRYRCYATCGQFGASDVWLNVATVGRIPANIRTTNVCAYFRCMQKVERATQLRIGLQAAAALSFVYFSWISRLIIIVITIMNKMFLSLLLLLLVLLYF